MRHFTPETKLGGMSHEKLDETLKVYTIPHKIAIFLK